MFDDLNFTMNLKMGQFFSHNDKEQGRATVNKIFDNTVFSLVYQNTNPEADDLP